jgi:hypothetical protein
MWERLARNRNIIPLGKLSHNRKCPQKEERQDAPWSEIVDACRPAGGQHSICCMLVVPMDVCSRTDSSASQPESGNMPGTGFLSSFVIVSPNLKVLSTDPTILEKGAACQPCLHKEAES